MALESRFGENLLDFGLILIEQRKFRLNLDDQIEIFILGEGADQFALLVDDGVDAEFAEPQFHSLGLELGEVEDVVHLVEQLAAEALDVDGVAFAYR